MSREDTFEEIHVPLRSYAVWMLVWWLFVRRSKAALKAGIVKTCSDEPMESSRILKTWLLSPKSSLHGLHVSSWRHRNISCRMSFLVSRDWGNWPSRREWAMSFIHLFHEALLHTIPFLQKTNCFICAMNFISATLVQNLFTYRLGLCRTF